MNKTNIMLMEPGDVLFFRDGRPMEGSLAGNGAAWPMPSVINAALYAALHRSGVQGHLHDHQQNGSERTKDARLFGSLVSEGPFPVRQTRDGGKDWFFPRPEDLGDDTTIPAYCPVDSRHGSVTSLPAPLIYPVGNRLVPVKESKAKSWLNGKSYQDYLDGKERKLFPTQNFGDDDIFDTESQVGIEIDPCSGTTGGGDAKGKIYSARYLRLRSQWKLGVFAKTDEKSEGNESRRDLIREMISQDSRILVGGQQRTCSVTMESDSRLSLPRGRTRDFYRKGETKRVKWVLLSPAVYPVIPDKSANGKPLIPHSGGWLPSWIRESDGCVMLRSGKRKKRSYGDTHRRGFDSGGTAINARLVSAIIPKPVVITGWALGHSKDRPEGGAKSSHLAVPAGAVYYFEAENEEHAGKLADALNWHGDDQQSTVITNRRSALMGEKGFGLGVCGTWEFIGNRMESGRH